MRLICTILAAMLAGTPVLAGAAEPVVASSSADQARPTAPVVLRDNVAVPMRDGATLRALIALPAGGAGRWPVVLTITPYQRDGGWGKAQQFARAGFVFVAIDTRGRGDSGGKFDPWTSDGADAYDAIEWIARQSFSDGNIGMWGSSYGGYNQWAAAATRPPHLKSIMPAAAGLPGTDFPMNRNMMRPYAASWAGYVSAKTGHDRFFSDLAYQTDAFERLLKTGRSQADLPTELGLSLPAFGDWIEHPAIDDWWRARSPTPAQYAAIDIPVLTITGQWDGAQSSALEHRQRHLAARPGADHFLVIGAFDHAGTRFPQTKVGGITLPANAVIDMFALDLAWFDWTLRGGPKPAFLQDRFAYYVLGLDEWRYAGAPALATAERRTMWLGDKAITNRPTRVARRDYRNDPADFTKFRLGTWLTGSWLTYNTDVEALRDDGLVYETAPLVEAITLVGHPSAVLPLAIETPDADFRVRLYEVAADGSVIILAQDRIRARWNDSLERPNFAPRGKRVDYEFGKMGFVARTIAPGRRLRLVVDTPNSIYEQRNFNSGKEVVRETIADARATRVTMFEGGKEGARIELPIAADD